MKFESIIHRASFKESQALNKNIKILKLLEIYSIYISRFLKDKSGCYNTGYYTETWVQKLDYAVATDAFQLFTKNIVWLLYSRCHQHSVI